MVKQFLPHLKTKIKAAIMNVHRIAFVSIAHLNRLLPTKAGLHSFTEFSVCTEKTAKVEGI